MQISIPFVLIILLQNQCRITYYAVLSCLHKEGFHQTIPNFEFWTKKWPFDHEDNGQMDSLSKMVLKDGIRQNPSVIGTHRDRKPNVTLIYFYANNLPQIKLRKLPTDDSGRPTGLPGSKKNIFGMEWPETFNPK